MQRFTQLRVWRRAHDLTLRIYRTTARFPTEERFGLTSQIRRAAVSVGANLAEGAKRRSNPDFARFLNIAEGSLAEVEYLLTVSRDLDLVERETAAELLREVEKVSRMVYVLRSKVEMVR